MRTRKAFVVGGVVVASLALGSSAAMADSARPAPTGSVLFTSATIAGAPGKTALVKVKPGSAVILRVVPGGTAKLGTGTPECVVLTAVPGAVPALPATGKAVALKAVPAKAVPGKAVTGKAVALKAVGVPATVCPVLSPAHK